MVIYMLVSLFCGMLNVKVLLNFGLVFFDFVFVLVFFRGFLLCISIILIWVFKIYDRSFYWILLFLKE